MSKIFIIHGWAYNLDKWDNIKPELKKLGIIAEFLKVPGLTEPSDQVWTIDDYVGWLKDKLKDESSPIVVGHSNGGRIAMSYIQRYPDHIRKLILIDSAGVAHNEKRSSAKLKTLKYISKLGKPLAYVPPARKFFYKVIGAQDYLNAPANMKLTMSNMLKADQNIDFAKIKLPVTIIWGREDTITPLSDGEKIHQGIAGSKLVIIDEARHAPMYTHAKQVAAAIKSAVEGTK